MTIAAISKPAVGVLGVCLAAGTLAVASADRPGGGDYFSSGNGTALVADAGDSSQALAAVADEDKASVVKEAAEEAKAKAAEAASEAVVAQPAAEAQGAKAAKAASAAEKRMNAARDAMGKNAPGSAFNPIMAPRLTVAAAAAAGSTNSPFAQPNWPSVSPFQFAPIGSSQLQERRVDRQSLKMEGEYWNLKAEGLQKKAEALEMKAQGLKEAGSRQEALEAEADAKLAAAEVKMSQINSRRIQDQLKAAGVSDLKSGSNGPQVSALQQRLNAKLKPSPELTVDGDFGPLTEQAVKDFQKKLKLETTGVVDDETAAALGLRSMTLDSVGSELNAFARGPMASQPSFNAVFTPAPMPTPAAAPSAPTSAYQPVQAVIAAPPSQAIVSTDQLSKLKQQVDELKKAKKTLEEQVKKLKGDQGR